MAKTENILRVMEERKKATGVPMTLFAACPNSLSVIKASFRAAKRNNAPIQSGGLRWWLYGYDTRGLHEDSGS